MYFFSVLQQRTGSVHPEICEQHVTQSLPSSFCVHRSRLVTSVSHRPPATPRNTDQKSELSSPSFTFSFFDPVPLKTTPVAPQTTHIYFTCLKNNSTTGSLYLPISSELQYPQFCSAWVRSTFCVTKQKMTALSLKIEELNVSQICCCTWLTLLLPNCDFLNTLMTAVRGICPLHIHMGFLL